MRHDPAAFTLIELLVVVTIIVVLLALLVPAMDKAIYQAELVVCSTNLKGVGTTALVYASENKRRYPHRSGMDSGNDMINWWPEQLRDPRDGGIHDDRPELAPYMDINKMLNCPLVGEVDYTLDGTGGSSVILANYEMYFGWKYRRSQVVHPPAEGRRPPGGGMFKLGDRWETDPGNNGDRYRMNLLAADVEYVNFDAPNAWASHPDKGGKLGEMVWQNYGDATSTDPNARAAAAAYGALLGYPAASMTWSRFDARASNANLTDSNQQWNRGDLDRNFAYDDGSVIRYTDIKIHAWRADDRFTFTSTNADAYNPLHNKHVPKR